MTKPHHRRLFLLVTLPLLVAVGWFLVPTTRADWTLVSSASPVSLGHGATLVKKRVEKGAGRSCELTLVFFDESHCILGIASNASKKDARSVKAIAQSAGAIAACNGGYFEPPLMLPAGLEIAAGVRTGTLDLKQPFGGALVIDGGSAGIVPTEKFNDSASVEGFLQCCPRLVEKGLAIELIGGENLAERTFVLTDGKGRWAIGVSKSIGLPDLASILSNPRIVSEFQVQSALNLDGGPSTGIWCRHAKGGETSSPERWKVRNAILVLPRKQGE